MRSHTALRALTALILATPGLAATVPLTPRADPECETIPGSSGLWVTADCMDPLFANPVIMEESDHETPLPHHRVVGHFEGTATNFSIYLPPKDNWDERFFQIVYPLQTHEAVDVDIGFALYSQGYFVQSRGQIGYRSDAAAAKFAKEVARQFYDTDRKIYGYVFGGSGGSFVTIGAIENTIGIWDGACPSSPNSIAVRGLASLVLGPKRKQIADAVMPGGSGNPWAELNQMEQAVLSEVTKFGIALPAFEDWLSVSHLNITRAMASGVIGMNPSYVSDFWSKPGYLGTEKSALGDFIRAMRSIQLAPWLSRIEVDFEMDFNPSGIFDFKLSDGAVLSAEFDGSGAALIELRNQVPLALVAGSPFEINNDFFLALTTLHRHQIPARKGFVGFDQFLQADGTPIYPQRPMEISSIIASSTTGGASFSGNVTGKIICVNNLADSEAFPVHADWYRGVVREAIGGRFDDNYRIWYQEHADHYMGPIEPRKENYLVDFTGVYHRALVDLSAWVERGIAPPASTGYEVQDGQIVVAKSAEDRNGVQPVVNFETERYTVERGQNITLEAIIELPKGSGPVASVEWDTRGTGQFVKGEFGETVGSKLRVKRDFRFCSTGTFFPNVRVATQRNGHRDSPYIRVYNLGRARIIVE
ncbi:hypothetical protein F5X68DRAFT_269996 [Plectosphaerella plurivora]|uniref:Uncharacterized protein n=1 Tax=Plectosphaerella plurivora TaxID=936078 RepID=A0A9P8V7D2_9PEZI|nr:hypothetical protein F5X68DRAFT_269996 [Plectosphaerella plurivora]